MKKINWKNLIIIELGTLMMSMAIMDWIVAIFRNGTFTIYGLFVNLLELMIAAYCYDYIDYKYTKKEND